ncbi:MAG: protein translocase subunit SecD [Pseudonocardiaceae bacterium]|nr:protein translocase subunit SecD [Pseudonocardiaceae bacterium]
MAPPEGHISPWRYLATFVGIIAVLYSVVFFTGDSEPTPELGIDLQGGTRVTLTARTPDGSEPTPEQLEQARQIIDERVNGLGVSGAEVVQEGANLIITVPGEEGEQARTLGQTAKLYFRKVVGQPVPVQPPAPPGAPAAPGGGQPPPGGDVAPAPDPGGSQPQGSPPQGLPVPVAPQQAVDPDVAAEIARARELRQSTDPQQQQQALQQLDCRASDPLRGNADPDLPLVTCNQDGTAKYLLEPAFMTGEQVANATSGMRQNTSAYVVNLDFTNRGGDIWGQWTAANVGQLAGIVLDGEVVSAPEVQGANPTGRSEISGQFTQAEAQELANVLKYGSLPLSFESSESQTVSPTLGLASLQAGLLAGAVGLAVVCVYCLFYYRMLGLLTILSLVLSGAVVYAVLVLLGRWIGFTLDLAGVAGFIVAIGITADSFVVFFERLKDEIREGRTFRSAVPHGWVRARRTILAGDTVSFLAAVVLYVLAVGEVKGFAFTLGMATVLDLIVVFLVTHPLTVVISQSKVLSRPSLSGLGAVQRMGAARMGPTGRAAVKGA